MKCPKCKEGEMIMYVHGDSTMVLGAGGGKVTTSHICNKCGHKIEYNPTRPIKKKSEIEIKLDKIPDKMKILCIIFGLIILGVFIYIFTSTTHI